MDSFNGQEPDVFSSNGSNGGDAMSSQSVIIIADDHPLFRGALNQAISNAFEGFSVVEAGTLDDVSSAIEHHEDVEVVLLDLAMPGMRGFTGLMYLRGQYPHVPVVMISATEDSVVMRRAMDLGASGFIPKSTEINMISDAVAAVLKGETWLPPAFFQNDDPSNPAGDELARRLASLTPQQVRVLMMLSDGLLNKQIAYELSVSEATVKAHVSAILQKLKVDSRTQAVITAARIESGNWQALLRPSEALPKEV